MALERRNSLTDLAIYTGNPLFREPLHVGAPRLPARESLTEYIDGIYARQWLTNDGPLVRQLEEQVAEYLNVRHCIAICNGTLALQLVAMALGLRREVIVPSFTFIATAHALQIQGIEPVFADVEPKSHSLDPRSALDAMSSTTSGILPVHLWGRSADVAAFERISEQMRVPIFFDAAHAFGCSHDGRMVGGFGSAEVFSFHATKFFNTVEGGAVTTNDDALASELRLMRNFGFTGLDAVATLGTNAKMSEFHAAVGLANFASLQDMIGANQTRFKEYRRHLAGVDGIRLLQFEESERNNFQYVVANVESGFDRDFVVAALRAENVLVRRYFWPGCHRMEPYASTRTPRVPLTVTSQLADSVLVLPNGPLMTPRTIEAVCALLALALGGAAL